MEQYRPLVCSMEHPASLPSELLQLSQVLQHKVESIATGSQDIRDAALLATQYLFKQALQSEPEAISSINQLVSSLDPLKAPQTRSKTNGKRKRSPSLQRAAKPVFRTTPLTSLFVEGMSEDQIWAQLDIRTKNMCDILNLVVEEDGPLESGDENENEDEGEDEGEDSLLVTTVPVFGEEEDEWSGEEDDSEDEEDEVETESGDEEQAETIAELRYPSSEEDDEQTSRKVTLKLPKKRLKSSGLSELDDGFFDLADFNAEIEAAEAMSSTRGRLGGVDEEASNGEEELDYFAPVDHQSQSAEDEDTHELYYKDFFVPPMRQQPSKTPAPPKQTGKVRFHEEVRVKKIKAKGKGQPVSTLYDEEDDFEYNFGELDDAEDEYGESDDHINESEADDGLSSADLGSDEGNGRETIDRFKDDLFAEEEEEGAQEDMTMHEKRMATLSKQIAEFEAENVAPKEWVLMGEANSRSRPQNSLLEEDLEFERVMKPVPIVTEETVHALEDRIKNRILEGRFDDVIRIRPHEEKPFLPSRLIELRDTKSAQSLAQIYEDEYVAAQTGEVVGEDRDGRLRKEHEDIEKLWESICHKLDALSNAHFTPKQPKAVISTVSNVPVTTLESALPTTKSATSMMAPEEIHAPVTGELRARSEMTPSEKKALHNKRKKTQKKTRDLLEKSVDKFAQMKNPKKQKQKALESVVKVGKGVTVVGKQNKDLLKKRRKS